MSVMGVSSVSYYRYYEKYQRCHNNSIETYGCAPPDQLYNDANAFFNSLTKRYGCNKKEGALNAPLVAHVELEAGTFQSRRDGSSFYYYEFCHITCIMLA